MHTWKHSLMKSCTLLLEFDELEGYILIFLKALYGLKSSAKRWAEVIHSILIEMKFTPSNLNHAFGSGKHLI